MHRLSAAVAVGLGIVLAIPGAISALAWNADAAQEDISILRVGMLQGVSTLSPFIAYEDSEYVVFNLIYDRLMSYDEDLDVMPLIATSWEVGSWDEEDDPLTTENEGADRLWRYHIVEDAKWHDGEPLTADDVAYSINLNLADEMWAYTPYINSRVADHATATDDSTVEVYLKIPNVHVDALSIPIVPKHIWSQFTPAEIQYNVANDNPVGSGPFKFKQFVPDERVVLERNPNYFGGPVAYDELVFLFYGSDQIMAQALKRGDIDVGKFPPLTYESLLGEANIGAAAVKKYYQSTLGFNSYTDAGSGGNRLLLDENLRRALHMAIDKQYVIDTVWRGYADMGYALPAPVIPEYHWVPSASEELKYDVVAANALLNASGYDKWTTIDGKSVRVVNITNHVGNLPLAPLYNQPVSFKFMIRNDNAEDIAAAPYVKEMWEKVGVKATIQLMEESAMETAIYSYASHDAYMWYWSGDYDPTYILGVMTTDQLWGWNDPFWSNATYDEMYIEQMSQDGQERIDTVKEMQKIWYLSSGMIVLSYPYGLYAWNTERFENWGDPEAHPGRTIDHYFGAAPLFMELEPTGGGGSFGLSDPVLIGIVVAVVAIIAVAAFVLMRRRKEGGSAETMKEEKKTGLE